MASKKNQINLEEELGPLIGRILEYNPNADVERIKKAFSLTDRFSWAMAKMLIGFKADSATIISSLLCNPFQEKRISDQQIERDFGKEVLGILLGVLRIGMIRFKSNEAENVRKVIFAMSKDVRIILIKLAEMIQRMRDLKAPGEKEQAKQISEEILSVYAPIAYKLGIYSMKSELEDSALYFLKPDVYEGLKKKIAETKEGREMQLSSVVEKVRSLLEEKGIRAQVIGRAKHFYSIYKKMMTQNRRFEDILDLIAIRVITENVDDCYRALGVIHSAYTPIISEFYDYIANPKPNMYQSIHTKVIFESRPIEVQIRTLGMHQIAEEGIASHWRYKDTERDKLFDKKIAWMKQILEWKSSAAAREFIDSLKIDLFKNEIITLTPEGDPISLPEEATPVDFAYHVHTEVGNSCERAKVNGEIAPLDYKLKAGDIVEIITSKKAKPSRNWLQFTKTTFARSKIRESLGIKGIQSEWPAERREFRNMALEGRTKEQTKLISKEIPKPAKCCYPKEGDRIIAIITKDNKITVHKADCINLKAIEDSKKIKAGWRKPEQDMAILAITVTDRTGLLADILNVIASSRLNVASINSAIKKDKISIMIELKYNDIQQLEIAITKIKQVKNVLNVSVSPDYAGKGKQKER